MLQPERLGISADREIAAALLNQWQSGCAEKLSANSAVDAATLERYLPSEEIERVTGERFMERDADHIRTAILFRTISEFATQWSDNDLDRIVDLFYYVVRNVPLEASHPEDLPLTPFEVLLLGRGTAADRAVVFAGLLRQLHIDAVHLLPTASNTGDDQQTGGTGESAQGGWWVGVLLDNRVYLFDMQLGLPLPAPDAPSGTPVIEQPATLADLSEHPEILEASYPSDHPLRSADTSRWRVQLIGDSGLWAPRMQVLEMSLAGTRSLVVYESLADNENGPGLPSRVLDAGNGRWSEEDVTIWSYPEDQIRRFEQLSERDLKKLSLIKRSFDAPIPAIKVDQQTMIVDFGAPSRSQLKTRISQLEGEFEPAIKSYINVRLRGNLPPQLRIPPEIRRLHAEAAENALFWGGICQFEQREYAAAVKTLADYIRRFPQGRWVPTSRYLLAISLASTDQIPQAIQVLESAATDDPHFQGYQVLLRHWRKP